MMADTTDTTPVTAGIPGALAAVYGEVAAIEARPPVDQGVSDETERSMMQRQGVFRLRSVPCSPSLRMERCWLFLTSFRDDRQGAVAIMVALLSVVLIGFAALAIDGGHLYWTRTQLQGAADASALAGVVVIPTNTGTLGTTEQSTIVGEARTYAQKNMSLANHGNIVATSDVKPGHWDPDTRTFYALSDIPTGEKADAVKVIARRAQVNGNPLGLFFAAVIGFRQTDVTAKAVAYAGPGDGTACILSLNKTEKNAIQITGTNNTDLGKCGIAAWSDDPEGITTTGTADIAVGEVCIAGGIKESGGVSWYPDPPDITEGCDYMPIDPLAYMQPPPVVPVCDAAHTDLILYRTRFLGHKFVSCGGPE